MTGMGLEILRTLPLLHAACCAGFRPRLWTFHPLAFNDDNIEIVPLQQGWTPLLPPVMQGLGAVWLPGNHPQGPYVCRCALNVARERGFHPLDEAGIDLHRAGSLPAFVAESARRLFPESGQFDKYNAGWGMYPADSLAEGVMAPTVLNLIGAHGNNKGVSDAALACTVASRVAAAYPQRQFVLLLHARVCAAQCTIVTASNVRILVHLDCDPRVARLLHRTAPVVTVEGGLAHSALQRGCPVILIGLAHWLNETAYLYDPQHNARRSIVAEFSVDELTQVIAGELAGF